MDAVVDPTSSVDDYGFPAGAELLRFATAANRAANPILVQDANPVELQSELRVARLGLVDALGGEALVEASATVAAFNGLVRVADGTGIELDDGLIVASSDVRADLKLDTLAGAANTRRLGATVDSISDFTDAGQGDRAAVERLFIDP